MSEIQSISEPQSPKASMTSETNTAEEPGRPDLKHLVDERCFQQLPRFSPPEPFKLSQQELDAIDLDGLVEKRLYIPAALRAQEKLISTDAGDHATIFRLWHIRMKCLLLARLGAAAKEESRLFGDLGADHYRVHNGLCIVPWEFRLLMVNIQAGDTQLGLNKYYTLAREARVEEVNADNSDLKNELRPEAKVWRNRLRVLGLYVGSILASTGDIPGAIEHFSSLHDTAISGSAEDQAFAPKAALALALVYLKTGDSLTAREWFQKSGDQRNSNGGADIYSAICSCADADWTEACSILEKSSAGGKEREVVLQNDLAIAKLHDGQLTTAIEILEKAVKQDTTLPVVLTNLFTLYDLQHGVANKSKQSLLESLRESGIDSLGTYEFLRANKA